LVFRKKEGFRGLLDNPEVPLGQLKFFKLSKSKDLWIGSHLKTT